MKRCLITVFCFAAIFFTAGARSSAETTFGDIAVIPDPDESGKYFYHGYIEYRFHIANLSPTRAHEVELVVPDRSYYVSGGTIRRITRQVNIMPGTTVIVSLFQLPMEITGTDAGVIVDGRSRGTVVIPVARFNANTYSPSRYPRILMSRSIDSSAFMENIARHFPATNMPYRGTSHGTYGGPSSTIISMDELVRSELDPPQWKDNWLAYSSFDGIVLTESDMQQMSIAAKQAIIRYVECGGSLLVGGALEIPRPWNQYPLQVAAGLKGYNVGFGQCIISSGISLNNLDKNQLQSIWLAWQKSREPWRLFLSPEQANASFPIVDKVSLPLRAIFILMTSFALAIGLNFFILHRIKRPIWMLWTVPLLSGITAAVVIIYAFVSEGVTPTLRIEGLTLLDQYQHRATTIGLTGYYCPLTSGSGLHFGFDCELTTLFNREYGARRNRSSTTIDLSRDQHLASGWISARVPEYFMIRKSELRRERLEIKPAGSNSMAVVNGLGAEISKLWVADRNGEVFTAGAPIPAGKQALLVPVAGKYALTNTLDQLGRIYAGQNWQVAAVCVSNQPAALPIAGSYTAFIDATPFIEKGLPNKAREKLRSVVVGFWGEE